MLGYLNRAVPNSPAATPVHAATAETEIAYMVNDGYRLAIAAPVSPSGVTNNAASTAAAK